MKHPHPSKLTAVESIVMLALMRQQCQTVLSTFDAGISKVSETYPELGDEMLRRYLRAHDELSDALSRAETGHACRNSEAVLRELHLKAHRLAPFFLELHAIASGRLPSGPAL